MNKSNLDLDLPNIQALNEVFGVTLGVPEKGDPSFVLRHLASNRESVFARHIMARLLRIGRRYHDDSVNLQKLQTALQTRLFTDRHWASAYAEFCALDFFLFPSRFKTLLEPPDLDCDIDPSRTYSVDLGNKHANVDLRFNWLKIYSDVKILQDNVGDFFRGIYDDVWRGQARPLIAHDSPVDRDDEVVKRNRAAIVEALRGAKATQETLVTASLVPDGKIRFSLDWKTGLQVSEYHFDPYRHAKELHPQVFRHAKKFVRDSAFFLTYVKSSLYQPYLDSFGDQNRIFYRAFARRAFLQHQHSGEKFSAVNSSFRGSETIAEVFRSLAGILFIEDDWSGDDEDTTRHVSEAHSGAKGFFFINPHASHSLSLLEDHIMCETDDFRDDIY